MQRKRNTNLSKTSSPRSAGGRKIDILNYGWKLKETRRRKWMIRLNFLLLVPSQDFFIDQYQFLRWILKIFSLCVQPSSSETQKISDNFCASKASLHKNLLNNYLITGLQPPVAVQLTPRSQSQAIKTVIMLFVNFRVNVDRQAHDWLETTTKVTEDKIIY